MDGPRRGPFEWVQNYIFRQAVVIYKIAPHLAIAAHTIEVIVPADFATPKIESSGRNCGSPARSPSLLDTRAAELAERSAPQSTRLRLPRRCAEGIGDRAALFAHTPPPPSGEKSRGLHRRPLARRRRRGAEGVVQTRARRFAPSTARAESAQRSDGAASALASQPTARSTRGTSTETRTPRATTKWSRSCSIGARVRFRVPPSVGSVHTALRASSAIPNQTRAPSSYGTIYGGVSQTEDLSPKDEARAKDEKSRTRVDSSRGRAHRARLDSSKAARGRAGVDSARRRPQGPPAFECRQAAKAARAPFVWAGQTREGL